MTTILAILTLWIACKIQSRKDKKRGYSTKCPGVLDPPSRNNVNIIIKGKTDLN